MRGVMTLGGACACGSERDVVNGACEGCAVAAWPSADGAAGDVTRAARAGVQEVCGSTVVVTIDRDGWAVAACATHGMLSEREELADAQRDGERHAWDGAVVLAGPVRQSWTVWSADEERRPIMDVFSGDSAAERDRAVARVEDAAADVRSQVAGVLVVEHARVDVTVPGVRVRVRGMHGCRDCKRTDGVLVGTVAAPADAREEWVGASRGWVLVTVDGTGHRHGYDRAALSGAVAR